MFHNLSGLGLILLAACTHPHVDAAIATPKAGVSIAMYGKNGGGAFGVVDDRRWVEVKSAQVVLDDVDPGAALPSLVIETLSGAPLALGPCARDRVDSVATESEVARRIVTEVATRRRPPPMPVPQPPQPPGVEQLGPSQTEHYAPAVHCTAVGGPGKRLVRLLYVSSTLAYHAEHDVDMTTPDHVKIATRFAIDTPSWTARDGKPVSADVVLYDGVPGADRAPVEVGRGPIDLDGSTAVIAPPPRDVPGKLRRVYDGAIENEEGMSPTDPSWNIASHEIVWVWLEMPGLRLPPGPLHVHVELDDEGTHDVIVPAEGRRDDDAPSAILGGAEPNGSLRLPLWTDENLHGNRQRFVIGGGGSTLRERLIASVSNMGDVTREVWIEEKLRPARKRVIAHAWPKKPGQHGDRLGTKVEIKPQGIERTGYELDYSF